MPLNKEEKKAYDKARRDGFRQAGKCARCGAVSEKLHCSVCSEYFKQKALDRQKKYLEAGLCRGCGAQPAEGHRDCQKCLDNQADSQAKRSLKIKEEVFTHYGGIVCACVECDWHNGKCLVAHTKVLTLDHINNDGAAQRKELGADGKGARFYLWLRKNNYPSGYQVLCMNCNWCKFYNQED